MTYWLWVLAGIVWCAVSVMVSTVICLGIRHGERQARALRRRPEETP